MKNNSGYSSFLFYTLITLTLFNCTLVFAEDKSLERILVTAQKKVESLQETPLSISTLSSRDIERLGLYGATEMATQIPNVTISTPYSESQPSFSIRGVSMSDFSQNQSSPIAMYVDDIYKGVGALQALQLFDLERIEVLRGPQGTLYGKNATGGAVAIISRQPQLSEEHNGHLSLSYGSFDRIESEGAADFTFSEDVFGIRAAYSYAKSNGWIDNILPQGNDAGKTNDYTIRLTANYKPTSEFSAIARYSKSKTKQPDGYEVFANNIGPGGVGFFTEYDRNDLDFFESELDRDSSVSIENESISLSLNWDITSALTLTSITSYDEGNWLTEEDSDGSPFNILHSDFTSKVRSAAQDFRVSSDFEGPFNFLLGIYGHHENLDASVIFRTYYEFAGDANNNGVNDCFDDFITGCRLSNSLKQIRDSKAVYFQGVYDLSERFSLTVGIRYTDDKTELADYDASVGFLDPVSNTEVLDAFQTIVDYSDMVSDTNLGTRIALDFQIDEKTLTYLSFTTGYRNSAFNGQAFFDSNEITIAKPEKVDAWEFGFKSDVIDGMVRVNGAFFYYTYENQQFLDTTQQLLQVLVNADEAEIIGAELEVSAILTASVELSFGLGYLDTEYKDLNLRGLDLSGNELINAPRLNINTIVDWEIAELEKGSIFLTADTVFTDKQYFDAFNSSNAKQESYWVTNLRLSYTDHEEIIEIGLWIKNVGDSEYITSLTNLQESFNFDYTHRGKPRTFGIDLNYRF